MENKKMWNKIFFKDFSNFNFRKKKERWKKRKKRKKEGRAQFVINYHTPFPEPNNSTYFLPFVPEKKKLEIWF